MAPRFHALLEAYGARSGVPVLLNTSFNLAGEPIVNRAVEGYSTFRRCGIDLLVAGRTVVSRRARRVAERPRRRRHDQSGRGKLSRGGFSAAGARAVDRRWASAGWSAGVFLCVPAGAVRAAWSAGPFGWCF